MCVRVVFSGAESRSPRTEKESGLSDHEGEAQRPREARFLLPAAVRIPGRGIDPGRSDQEGRAQTPDETYLCRRPCSHVLGFLGSGRFLTAFCRRWLAVSPTTSSKLNTVSWKPFSNYSTQKHKTHFMKRGARSS